MQRFHKLLNPSGKLHCRLYNPEPIQLAGVDFWYERYITVPFSGQYCLTYDGLEFCPRVRLSNRWKVLFPHETLSPFGGRVTVLFQWNDGTKSEYVYTIDSSTRFNKKIHRAVAYGLGLKERWKALDSMSRGHVSSQRCFTLAEEGILWEYALSRDKKCNAHVPF
jgi:hypothetical protein